MIAKSIISYLVRDQQTYFYYYYDYKLATHYYFSYIEIWKGLIMVIFIFIMINL